MIWIHLIRDEVMKVYINMPLITFSECTLSGVRIVYPITRSKNYSALCFIYKTTRTSLGKKFRVRRE